MFTKYHYEQIAKVAKTYAHGNEATDRAPWNTSTALPEFLSDLSRMLEIDNPRFDRRKFMAACGFEWAHVERAEEEEEQDLREMLRDW